jgi:prohibitin 2
MIRRFFVWLSNWTNGHWVELFATGAVFLLLVFVLWPQIVYNVPPGSVGVMWHRFFGGTVTTPGRELREGIHFIFPWDKIYMYDARLQRINEHVKGLSIDGLEISVNVSSRFVINSQYAGYLHKGLGPQYQETLMKPQLRTLILTYISEHEASHLYSTRREQVQATVQTHFQRKLANISSNVPFEEAYVDLEDVLIEEITLPTFVRNAIEEKERVRHMSDAYDFRLRLEEKERQRKRIEAEGIRSFQEIVAPGITPSYLRWRGIEATLQLAQSNNAKVVIIGGENGLPIILNTESGLDKIGADQLESSTAKNGADTGAQSDPTQLRPRRDLLKMPSLAGPAPLTASGSELHQTTVAPPEVPQAQHGATGAAASSSVGNVPLADPNAEGERLEWLKKLMDGGSGDSQPPKQ